MAALSRTVSDLFPDILDIETGRIAGSRLR